MKFLDEIGLIYLIDKLKEMFNKKADKIYVDNKVKTDVPTGARFTDTTYDLSPYMRRNNDTLGTYTEKIANVGGTGIINLDEGNVFIDTPKSNRSYMIASPKDNVAHSFTLQIDMGTVRSITFPKSVKWQGGEAPDLTKPNTVYILTFMTVNGGITWLGWNERVSSEIDISGKADKTYVDNKVKTNVPVNAKFTDTVYTHPSTHPASMIVESAARRFVSDVEKVRWSNKQDKLGYTPLNKAGDIMTGDLVLRGSILSTEFKPDNWSFINHYTGGGWARGIVNIKDKNKKNYMQIGVHGGGQNFNRMYFGRAYNDWAMEIFPSNNKVNFGGSVTKSNREVATEDYVIDRVKTPVPTNAKFTDTIVDISGKADKIEDEETGDGYSFTVINGVPYMRKTKKGGET